MFSYEAERVLLEISHEENALEDIKRSLSHLMKESPVEVYAIVLDLLRAPQKSLPSVIIEGVKELARSAARNSLRDPPLDTWSTEMNVGEEDYSRFTAYRTRCRDRLLEFLATGEFIRTTGTAWIWYDTRCGVCSLASERVIVPDAALETEKYQVKWWVTCLERIMASVREFPCEKPFKRKRIWNSTLQELKVECPTCHMAAVEEFPLFKEELLSAVTKVIDGVRIQFVGYVCLEANSASNRSSWRLNIEL